MKGLGFRLKSLLFIMGQTNFAPMMSIEGYTDLEISLEEMSLWRTHLRELVQHLLKAPQEQLDPQMVEKIKTWSDPPTALQILEVLDACIFSSLASGMVVKILQLMYDATLKNEGKTDAEVVANATWRN